MHNCKLNQIAALRHVVWLPLRFNWDWPGSIFQYPASATRSASVSRHCNGLVLGNIYSPGCNDLYAHLWAIEHRLWFSYQLYDHPWHVNWSKNLKRSRQLHWWQKSVQYSCVSHSYHDNPDCYNDTYFVRNV